MKNLIIFILIYVQLLLLKKYITFLSKVLLILAFQLCFRSLDKAKENDAVAVIFDIDTFGGRVDAATQIKDAILSSDLLTIAFITRRAISQEH